MKKKKKRKKTNRKRNSGRGVGLRTQVKSSQLAEKKGVNKRKGKSTVLGRGKKGNKKKERHNCSRQNARKLEGGPHENITSKLVNR